MSYNHKHLEQKWQERWEQDQPWRAEDDSTKPKFYCLIEFPYPSGAGLHVGHPRSYSALDAVCRKRRMEGFNVLYPIGWDAFGLPTENYAIKTGRKPQEITQENTDTFRRQLKALGLSFDWSREVNTTDPAYYKWTQWMFLEFFKAGLAYKAKTMINWCPKDKIGLANEEAAGGVCDRCGGAVEKREKEQWMIAITKYADRLLSDLDTVNYLPKIKKQQADWIGKSVGINITYKVEGLDKSITVFTTRPDTNFGATFVAAAPDGQFVRDNIDQFPQKDAVAKYVAEAAKKTDADRMAEGRKKTGVFTGLYAINQLTNRKMPIWVADFALGNVGTGALVGVPGHDVRDFEFATAFGLEIVRVVVGSDGDTSPIGRVEQVQEEKGTMINSGFLDGLNIHVATETIMDHLEEAGWGKRTVSYKLRDWVFSRQRYWGEPIPLVHCEDHGWVAIPDDQLPLKLPEVEKYEPTDNGESPLATISDWVNTQCPTCGRPAKRETDTMPNWAGSSWYFLRYLDPKNEMQFASPEKLKHWMPVDLYNGGMEHTTLHLLYSRFWNKFLFDRGLVPTSEPYARRHSHGLVMAEDGTKMSKSKGNVINPDEIVDQYGADALRTYIMFMGPFEEPVPWSTNGLIGVRRFLDKVMALSDKIVPTASDEVVRMVHKTIKKVGEDIEVMKFNTAIAQLMICVNTMQEAGGVSSEFFNMFLKVLFPFAPHLASELWEKLGHTKLLDAERWPSFDAALVVDDLVAVSVQVMGKLRGTIQAPPNASQGDVEAMAKVDPNVAKYLEGQAIKKVIYIPGRTINFVI